MAARKARADRLGEIGANRGQSGRADHRPWALSPPRRWGFGQLILVVMPEGPHDVRVVGRYVLCDGIAGGGMATVHLGRLLGPAGFAAPSRSSGCTRTSRRPGVRLDVPRRGAARGAHPPPERRRPRSTSSRRDGELFLVMEYVAGRVARAAAARRGGAPASRSRRGSSRRSSPDVLARAARRARGDGRARRAARHRPPRRLAAERPRRRRRRRARPRLRRREGGRPRSQTTRDGQLKGKLAYMAPEQIAAARRSTRRTDVFAAGVVLWEVLTGRRLFRRRQRGGRRARRGQRDSAAAELRGFGVPGHRSRRDARAGARPGLTLPDGPRNGPRNRRGDWRRAPVGGGRLGAVPRRAGAVSARDALGEHREQRAHGLAGKGRLRVSRGGSLRRRVPAVRDVDRPADHAHFVEGGGGASAEVATVPRHPRRRRRDRYRRRPARGAIGRLDPDGPGGGRRGETARAAFGGERFAEGGARARGRRCGRGSAGGLGGQHAFRRDGVSPSPVRRARRAARSCPVSPPAPPLGTHCDPPYRIDSSGRKIFKVECL